MTEHATNSLITLKQQASGSDAEPSGAVRKKCLTFSISLHSFDGNSHVDINTFHHIPVVATVLLDGYYDVKRDYCEFKITSSDRFLDLRRPKAALYS
jgi:hypothetical protein